MTTIARRTLWGERLVFAALIVIFAAGLMPTRSIGPAQMAVAAQQATTGMATLAVRTMQ